MIPELSARAGGCPFMKFAAPILLFTMLAAPALAQAPKQPEAVNPAPAAPADPRACAPGERATVGTGAAPQTPQTPIGVAPRDNLSDKLARTDGVICPPENVDPEIRAPAPGGGALQVIPPPGSPGGAPDARPK